MKISRCEETSYATDNSVCLNPQKFQRILPSHIQIIQYPYNLHSYKKIFRLVSKILFLYATYNSDLKNVIHFVFVKKKGRYIPKYMLRGPGHILK